MTPFPVLRKLLLAATVVLAGAAQAASQPAVQPAAQPVIQPAAQPISPPAAAAAAASQAPPPSLTSAAAMAPIPSPGAHVTDQVGMLTPAQRTALESVLAEYERRTGSQIAIVLLASTAPDPIEHYSIRVADAWKVGRKGIDDGVLIVVAKNNPASLRRLRIEAGRGVQGTLTDAQSKRILQDTIAPHFRQNDYYGGLAAGVAAITSLLDQEHFAAPKPKAMEAADMAENSWPFLLVAVIIMAVLLRSRGGGGPGLRHSRGDWSDAGGVVLGALIGNALGRAGRGGGFSGGGGFSDGGGGRGDGLSGGGGSFDGGGASGDW